MSPSKPASYADAVNQARQLTAAARLADPGEHYPYRHADVAALVEQNPPMGPEGPDDGRARAEDYMTQAVADASRDMIEAQAKVLGDPSESSREWYERAKETLVAARQAHRANRPVAGNVIGIRARRAGE